MAQSYREGSESAPVDVSAGQVTCWVSPCRWSPWSGVSGPCTGLFCEGRPLWVVWGWSSLFSRGGPVCPCCMEGLSAPMPLPVYIGQGVAPVCSDVDAFAKQGEGMPLDEQAPTLW